MLESRLQNARCYDECASGGLDGGINIYAYLNGDPISKVDPLGLMGGGGSGRKVPLSNLLTQTWNNFAETNQAIPGILTPVGFTLLTAGTTANAIGGLTVLQLAELVSAGVLPMALYSTAVAAVALTAAVNFAVVGTAFEVGVAVGSLLRAVNQCYASVTPPYFSDLISRI